MTSIRDVFVNEGLTHVPGAPRSVAEARAYQRDLGRLLWLLWEGLEVPPSEKRIIALKQLVQDRGAREMFTGAVAELVEQTPDRKSMPPGSIVAEAMSPRLGLEGTGMHVMTTVRLMLQSVDGISSLQLLPMLCEYGFPVVQVSHKLAASLMVTRVPAEIVDGMELPWPVFEIDLPEGMFHSARQEAQELSLDPLKYMLVGRSLGRYVAAQADGSDLSDHAYAMIAHGARDSLWNVQQHLKDLGDVTVVNAGISNDPWPDRNLPGDLEIHQTPTELDNRTTQMLARLFVNVALLMTASGNSRPIGKGHGRPYPAGSSSGTSSGKRRSCPFPVSRIFQLTTPVRHDFRKVTGDYMRGGGKSPSVQGFVVGHWKMQVHGSGRTQRRPQFIEPYWRGPEDAPIAVRPHKLK